MDKRRPAQAEAERLVDAYADLILRLSYTYLKSTHDAEDICQNVLFKLMSRTDPFENAEHERSWVIRAAANACKDVLRSGFRRTSAPLDEMADPPAPELPESNVLDQVMRLPQNYREAIYLHYYEGYSLKEIAEMTGRSESAVAAHASRGRAKLRAMLKEESDER